MHIAVETGAAHSKGENSVEQHKPHVLPRFSPLSAVACSRHVVGINYTTQGGHLLTCNTPWPVSNAFIIL